MERPNAHQCPFRTGALHTTHERNDKGSNTSFDRYGSTLSKYREIKSFMPMVMNDIRST